MRALRLSLAAAVAVAAALALAAPAGAHVAHTVQRGETLWSIAAQSNLTTRTLAAYNGLPEGGRVVLGARILVPSVAEGTAALAGQIPRAKQDPVTGGAMPVAPPVRGGYVVRPGDTLTGIAAHAGVSVVQMANMNGLPRDARLIAGTVLKLPGGVPGPVARPGVPGPSAPARCTSRAS